MTSLSPIMRASPYSASYVTSAECPPCGSLAKSAATVARYALSVSVVRFIVDHQSLCVSGESARLGRSRARRERPDRSARLLLLARPRDHSGFGRLILAVVADRREHLLTCHRDRGGQRPAADLARARDRGVKRTPLDARAQLIRLHLRSPIS